MLLVLPYSIGELCHNCTEVQACTKKTNWSKKSPATVPSILGHRALGALRLGIGDDSAILSPGGRNDWVLSCDAFLEGVHFLAKAHPARLRRLQILGPRCQRSRCDGCVASIFLNDPRTTSVPNRNMARRFSRRNGRAARYLGMRLIGGDTTKSRSVSISITVLGEVSRGPSPQPLRRPSRRSYICYRKAGPRPARPAPCASESGAPKRASRTVLRQHLYPRIPVKLGEWLARNQIASAMMDISDGLSTDLSRLCTASRVGARIEAQRVPCISIPPGLFRWS